MAKKTKSEQKLRKERYESAKKVREQRLKIHELQGLLSGATETLAELNQKYAKETGEMGHALALARVTAMFLQRSMHLLKLGLDTEDPVAWRLAVTELFDKYDQLVNEVQTSEQETQKEEK